MGTSRRRCPDCGRHSEVSSVGRDIGLYALRPCPGLRQGKRAPTLAESRTASALAGTGASRSSSPSPPTVTASASGSRRMIYGAPSPSSPTRAGRRSSRSRSASATPRSRPPSATWVSDRTSTTPPATDSGSWVGRRDKGGTDAPGPIPRNRETPDVWPYPTSPLRFIACSHYDQMRRPHRDTGAQGCRAT